MQSSTPKIAPFRQVDFRRYFMRQVNASAISAAPMANRMHRSSHGGTASTAFFMTKKAPPQIAAAKQAEREAEKQRKATEKAEKERIAKERRQRADELREERAERARRNDTVLGRMKNTAIATVSREVTRTLTRGILGGLTGKKN